MSIEIKIDGEPLDIGDTVMHFGNECSNQDRLGPHYHFEADREWSQYAPSASISGVLNVEQAIALRDDLAQFIVDVARKGAHVG